MPEISNSNKQSSRSGQEPRQSYRLAVRGQKKREKHHHKNSESKAANALYETCSNSKQKYKKQSSVHNFHKNLLFHPLLGTTKFHICKKFGQSRNLFQTQKFILAHANIAHYPRIGHSRLCKF